MTSSAVAPRKWPAWLPAAVGFLAVGLLVGGVGAWAVNTQIAGAVVAGGVVEVDSDRQIVQHPEGGVVGEIFARDGDRVEQGDLLLHLDGTFLRSNLEIIDRQLLELHVRQVRLAAERDGEDVLTITAPAHLLHLEGGWIGNQIVGQAALFAARHSSIRTSTEQLEEQKSQIEAQIAGLAAQSSALEAELELVAAELAGLSALLEKGLVISSRVTAFKRDKVRISGEIGRLAAAVGEAGARTAAIDLEILRLSDQRREEAITRLRDLRYSEIELAERRLSLHEKLNRLDVRAPISGVVFGSRVVAEQSVVRPADPIMFIVPSERPHHIAARVDPVHIDQVHAGQGATVRFTTFDQRLTPEIFGDVIRVSADVFQDEATGLTYYEAVVSPHISDDPALAGLQVLPGMPVEVYLRTENRTPMSYLLKPLTDYFRRSFREG